eukprot:Gb_34482 [translate_table: standard]
MGATTKACFICSNDSCACGDHSKATSFFRRFVNGLVFNVKLTKNLPRNPRFPTNDFISVSDLGGVVSRIDLSLLGSTLMTLRETMYPRALPGVGLNMHLRGFKLIRYFLYL